MIRTEIMEGLFGPILRVLMSHRRFLSRSRLVRLGFLKDCSGCQVKKSQPVGGVRPDGDGRPMKRLLQQSRYTKMVA